MQGRTTVTFGEQRASSIVDVALNEYREPAAESHITVGISAQVAFTGT
jgi:hypothetical protein